MLVSFAQSHFVAEHYFLPKLFLYTAMIFGWPKEYRNSQQHESFPKAESEVSFESRLVTCTETGTSCND